MFGGFNSNSLFGVKKKEQIRKKKEVNENFNMFFRIRTALSVIPYGVIF